MIAVIQRVEKAAVNVADKEISSIRKGFLILIGMYKSDTKGDLIKLVKKIVSLRIVSDENDKMNLSILDTKGEILLVSQFTLCADVKNGRRPSFIDAMEPSKANEYYLQFAQELQKEGVLVKTGQFGAAMKVSLINDGPVTILLDSTKV